MEDLLNQVSAYLGTNTELFSMVLGSTIFLAWSITIARMLGRGFLSASLTMLPTAVNGVLGIWPLVLVLVNGLAVSYLVFRRIWRVP